MPRTARLDYPGGVFHVISRFARDEWCLDLPGGRDRYLSLLGRAASRTDTQVLAYCMMSSHVHLVLMQEQEPLSRLLKSVNTGFATWVSKTGDAKYAHGPVFAGRPREVLVEREAHLNELVRYVHNNPVRAAVVRSARESDWSSHQAYIDEPTRPDWLEADFVLSGFGRRASTQAKRFGQFVKEGATEVRRPEFGGHDDAEARARMREVFGDGHRLSDGVLGSDGFVDAVRGNKEATVLPARRARRYPHQEQHRPALQDLIDTVLLVFKIEPWEFDKRPRARRCGDAKRLIIWLWVHEFGGAQIEVARALKISTSAVSQHYGKCMERAAEWDELASPVVAQVEARNVAKGKSSEVGARKRSGGPAARYHVDSRD